MSAEEIYCGIETITYVLHGKVKQGDSEVPLT
jgi:redox-sensitive bicupin YhaK (pirin superfamily)